MQGSSRRKRKEGTQPNEPFFTFPELANRWKVDYELLWNLMHYKRIPRYTRVKGKPQLYHASECTLKNLETILVRRTDVALFEEVEIEKEFRLRNNVYLESGQDSPGDTKNPLEKLNNEIRRSANMYFDLFVSPRLAVDKFGPSRPVIEYRIKLPTRDERLPVPKDKIKITAEPRFCRKGPKQKEPACKLKERQSLQKKAMDEAQRRWADGSKLNTVDMSKEIVIFLSENAADWVPVPETVADWIRTLNPNPQRGRPRKTR